jgi:hypothetical protein
LRSATLIRSALPAELHEMPKRRDLHAENRLASDRAFTADQPHLDRIALVGAGKHGNECVLDKVEMFDRDAGVLKHPARRECRFFKEGREALQVPLRQRPQQEIAWESRFGSLREVQRVLPGPYR